MNDKDLATCFRRFSYKIVQEMIIVLVINANSGFNGQRQIHLIPNSTDTISNKQRVSHQCSTCIAALYTQTRASYIEVNFIVIVFGNYFSCFSHNGRIIACNLDANSFSVMVFLMQKFLRSTDDGICMNHWSVEFKIRRQQIY